MENGKLIALTDTIDVSGANTASLITGRKGYIKIEECFIEVTTVLVGADTITLSSGGVDIATVATGTDAADYTQIFFSPGSDYTYDPNYQFASGDTITATAAGGATSGVVKVHLSLVQPSS